MAILFFLYSLNNALVQTFLLSFNVFIAEGTILAFSNFLIPLLQITAQNKDISPFAAALDTGLQDE